MVYVLTQLNNQYFETDGLIDGTTGSNPIPPGPTYINNATGTLKVKNPSGTFVVVGPASATSVTVTYISGSNGVYRALITSDFNPPIGAGYLAIIDLTTPGGAVAHWELAVEVKARRA